MKNKTIMVVSICLLSTMFLSISATASHTTDWENFAYGKLTNYGGDPGTEAELVDGIWNLKISDNQVWFYSCYQEKNIDPEIENSPEDSIDLIEFSLQGQPFYKTYSNDGHTYVVFAKFQVKKTWAQFDGTYTYKTWKTWMEITVNDDGSFLLDSWPPLLSPWDKVGTVTYTDLFD